MIRTFFFAAVSFALTCTLSANSIADPELLNKIVERLEKNESIIETYDFYQDANIKDVNKDGKVEKVEKRTYRTHLLEGHRYFELIKFDDKELDKDKKKEEAKNRQRFLKEIRKKEKDPDEEDDLTWKDLTEKYEFTSLPAEGDAAYVISFKPRPGKLKERSRMEKIVNRLAGTFWVSSDYNVIKAAANLTSALKYGLGVLANVEELHLKFEQAKVDGVWLPDTFNIHYKARVFVKTRNREIQNRYYNPTKRSTNAGASAAQHQ